MSRAKVELVEYNRVDDDSQRYEYIVSHDNGSTTVSQRMVLDQFSRGWKASMDMDDIPEMQSHRLAALKLADWLQRMAAAIKSGDYQEVDTAEFKELK